MNLGGMVRSYGGVRDQQVQQALQLQIQGQGEDQRTYPDEKRKLTGRQLLPTKLQACPHWSLAKAVMPPR